MKPEEYWEEAGRVGYATAMYNSGSVADHVIRRCADEAMSIAARIGLGPKHRVLELGCGDGTFAMNRLAPAFADVHAFDLSSAAIERAKTTAAHLPHLHFKAADICNLDLGTLGTFDGAFLMGILHHVVPSVDKVMKNLARVAPRVVVLEPNGNHILRKLLELTPSYRRAGEDSFTDHQLDELFARSGYEIRARRRMNLFPNFTPRLVYKLFQPIEPRVENNRVLNALCTVSMLGLVRSDAGL